MQTPKDVYDNPPPMRLPRWEHTHDRTVWRLAVKVMRQHRDDVDPYFAVDALVVRYWTLWIMLHIGPHLFNWWRFREERNASAR